MSSFDQLLDDLERLLGEVDQLDDPIRTQVFSLLDGIDTMHRMALGQLAEHIDPEELGRLRAADPAVAWLLDAYAIGIDEAAAAEQALDSIRPYLRSHGGDVAVVRAHAGVVRVRLSGACTGCTASTITLQRGVEEALRDGFAGFAGMEVEEQPDSVPHAPPGPTLLQIDAFPSHPDDRL